MQDETERFVPQDPIPCRVVMPAEVAFNLDNLHRAIDNLATKLGCETCFSGRSCVLDLEREFLVDAQTFEARGLSEGRS